MEDDFAAKMRQARGVAAQTRATVRSAKAAAVRDADGIIAAGELMQSARADFDKRRAAVVAAHQSVIMGEGDDLRAAAKELAAMEAELTQFGNALPLPAGEPPATAGAQPGNLQRDAWAAGDAYVGTHPDNLKT